MNVQAQIKEYVNSQPDPKRNDIEALHKHILKVLPKSKLWFLDGKDSKGKIVSNAAPRSFERRKRCCSLA